MAAIPAELAILGVVLLLIVTVAVPAITRGVSLPRELEFRRYEDGELPTKLLAYFQSLDTELEPLGFRPLLSFEVTNLQGGNLSRVYRSEHEAALLGAICLRGESVVPGGRPTPQNYVEWITRYEDGTALNTRNVTLSDLFDPMPGEIRQDFPGERSVGRLKARHDRRAEDLRVRGPRFPHGLDILAEYGEHHERWVAFQAERGLLRHDPESQVYRATAKAAWRGVANYLNPLADNFTPARFALGLLLGAGLPVLGVLAAGRPELPHLAEPLGLSPGVASWAALALAFTLGGAAVGALFTTKCFVWALLLGYVPIRLLAPGAGLELALVLWMGVVAEQVSSFVEKRRLLV